MMVLDEASIGDDAVGSSVRSTPRMIAVATGRAPDYFMRAPKGDLFAAHWTHQPLEAEVQGLQDHVLVYHVSGCTDVVKSVEGRIKGTRSRIGSVTLMPANTHMGWRIAGSNEVIHLYLRQQLLDEYCHDRLDTPRDPCLQDFFAIDDRWLQSFFAMLQAESTWLEQPWGDIDTLFLDQAQQILVRHMVEQYSDLGRRQRTPLEREPAPGRMRAAIVRRVCDYIEEHLADDIHLKNLAALACQSEDHFIRAFRLTVGCTPYQYLLARRVRCAKDLLNDKSLSIGEVARRAGFKSSCYFSATFRRSVGINPRAYRENRCR